MLTGIGLNDESLVTNLSAISFAYIRGRKIDKDDQSFSANRDLLTSLGKPYGVFVDFDYRPTGPLGSVQAKELADKDRGLSPLLPYIRVSPIEGMPFPSWAELAVKLSEMVYYYRTVYGKRDVGISTTVSIIKALVPYLTSELIDCWFNVVYWSETLPVLPAPFSTFPYWEQTNYDYLGAGFSKTAKIAFPGTVEDLLLWNKDTTKLNLIVWDEETPSQPSSSASPSAPPVDEDIDVDLTELVIAVEENTIMLNNINSTLQEIKQGFMNGWRL